MPDAWLLTPTVSEKILQDYIKRVRSGLSSPLAYYAVGEYGSNTGRPHYHFIAFTDSPIVSECPSISTIDEYLQRYHCDDCGFDCAMRVFRGKWPFGFVYGSSAPPAAMGYVAKHHVVPSRGVSKYARPPFSRMSKGLGLGYLGSHQVTADAYRLLHSPAMSYTPFGQTAALPRYLRERIFSPAELEVLFSNYEISPESQVSGEIFNYEFTRNSHKKNGKL